MAHDRPGIPFPYVHGLTPKGQRELERDFLFVLSQIVTGAGGGFDAIVVPNATSDDDARIYPTPYTAFNALAALGYAQARVGVMKDYTTSGDTTITETVNFTGTTLTNVSLIGLPAGDNNPSIGDQGHQNSSNFYNQIVWAVNTKTWSHGSGCEFYIQDMKITSVGRTQDTYLFGATGTNIPNLSCRNVYFACPSFSVSPLVIDIWSAENCFFGNVFNQLGSISGAAGHITLRDCVVNMTSTGSSPLTFTFGKSTAGVSPGWYCYNLTLDASGADHIFAFKTSQNSVFDGVRNHDASSGGGDDRATLRLSAGTSTSNTDQVYLRGQGENGGSGEFACNLDLNPSSAGGSFAKVVVEGYWGSITATNGYLGTMSINATCQKMDIRGGKMVAGNISIIQPSVTALRFDDTSLALQISVTDPDTGTAGTLLDINNCDTCWLTFIINEESSTVSPSASYIPYDIDSASSNGAMYYEARFTSGAVGAPVNSSATFLIWDHTGFSAATDAVDVTVDDSLFTVLTGTNAQDALDSADDALAALTSPDAADVFVDSTGYSGALVGVDDAQEAFDALDTAIAGTPVAADIDVDSTGYSGVLVGVDDVQEALDILDTAAAPPSLALATLGTSLNRYRFLDHFDHGQETLAVATNMIEGTMWTWSGTGTSVSGGGIHTTDAGQRWGVWRAMTGTNTTTTGRGGFGTLDSDTTGNGVFYKNFQKADNFFIRWVIKIPTITTAGQTFDAYWGLATSFGSAAAYPVNDFIGFAALAAGGNFTALSIDDTNQTSNSTAIAQDTAWHEFILHGDGTNLNYYVDGVLKVTQIIASTNVPDNGTDLQLVALHVQKQSGATSRGAYIDLISGDIPLNIGHSLSTDPM